MGLPMGRWKKETSLNKEQAEKCRVCPFVAETHEFVDSETLPDLSHAL